MHTFGLVLLTTDYLWALLGSFNPSFVLQHCSTRLGGTGKACSIRASDPDSGSHQFWCCFNNLELAQLNMSTFGIERISRSGSTSHEGFRQLPTPHKTLNPSLLSATTRPVMENGFALDACAGFAAF